jgi:hypothetical protein
MHGKLNLNKGGILAKEVHNRWKLHVGLRAKKSRIIRCHVHLYSKSNDKITRLLFTIDMGTILTTRMAFHVQGKVN